MEIPANMVISRNIDHGNLSFFLILAIDKLPVLGLCFFFFFNYKNHVFLKAMSVDSPVDSLYPCHYHSLWA